MVNNLKQVLQHITRFDVQELGIIAAAFKPRKVKKGSILLSHGEVCREFYYVYKGVIRTYYTTREGDEKTRYVMIDNHIGTAFASFIAQQPSFETIDAHEDTELLCIGHADFYRLVKEIPAFATFYQSILEMAYTFQGRKIESMVTLTAQQRYRQLLKENPALVQRLSNKILASYLDIRQETLSRVKGANAKGK